MNKIKKIGVHLRGGFSDRNAIKIENTKIQYESLDDRTRTALINYTDMLIQEVLKMRMSYDESVQNFLKSLMSDVYSQEVNYGSTYDVARVMSIVYTTIREDEYDAVLTVIEFLAKEIKELMFGRNDSYMVYNAIFEREFVGYRIVNGYITKITDRNEISAIEDTANIRIKEVQQHINKAVQHLSDRDKPDYENSIKESISAVEAMCSQIVGKKSTLGDALKHLEDNGINIHPSLKGAFSKLYGYTSDSKGIRHAGDIGGPDATFEEAKFMLVACCGFLNYLKSCIAD